MRSLRMTRAISASQPCTTTTRAFSGYKGFGSFHSEDVEELVAQACAPGWQAPSAPPLVAAAAASPIADDMRANFLLDDDWTFVNHGAFGAPCKTAFDAAAAWRRHAELQPLRFVDRELFPHLVASLKALGDVLRLSPRDLALAPNATAALNVAVPAAAAARGLGPGAGLLLLDCGYGSVRTLAAKVCAARGAELVEVGVLDDVAARGSTEGAAELVERALETNNIRVAVFDHYTSNSALRLPVAELAALCRARGVAVVVDGAHSLGSAPLDVAAIGADYFCGNLHKWYCSPRGSGFLWVRDRESVVEPLVVSHGYGRGFASDFIWTGAGDYGAPLALPALVDWWAQVGGLEAHMDRNAALLADATETLVAAWRTETLVDAASSAPSMALVRLPGPRTGDRTSIDGKAAQDALHFRHGVECPVKTVGGELYARVSAAPYNRLGDYERLAEAALNLGS